MTKFILVDSGNEKTELFDTIEDAREVATEWLDEDDSDTLEDVKLYKVSDVYTIVGQKKVLFKKENGDSE